MSIKGKRPMRSMTPNDKVDAIQRVNDGTSKAQVAREIGVPESTLRGWCKNEDKLRYQVSRQSPSESPRSDDSEPPGKRSRTESPETSNSPSVTGLSLSTSIAHNEPQLTSTPPDTPVALKKRSNPSTELIRSDIVRERRSTHGSSVAMSATSPTNALANSLATLNHVPLAFQGLSHFDLLAYATNLIHSSIPLAPSRTLRSVRTPKPGRLDNGANALANKNQHRTKLARDNYRPNGSNFNTFNSSTLDPLNYLFPQQSMLDLSASQATSTRNAYQYGQSNDAALPTKSAAPAAPYLLEYYSRFGGALTSPDEMMKAAASVPTTRGTDNILHSQLTKGKHYSDYTIPSQTHNINGRPIKAPESNYDDSVLPEVMKSSEEARSLEEAKSFEVARGLDESKSHEEVKNLEDIANSRNLEGTPSPKESKSPEVSKTANLERENKEPNNRQPSLEIKRTQKDLCQVLDNLICNNRNQSANTLTESICSRAGDWEQGLAEALDHGQRLLEWLEKQTSNPIVTQVIVGQLRTLLHNLRTRRGSLKNRNGTRRQ